MSTLTLTPSVPHPIADRLRGLICVLKPRRKTRPARELTVEWRCPAPTSRWFRCRRPLPCTSHAVPHWQAGFNDHARIIAKIVPVR